MNALKQTALSTVTTSVLSPANDAAARNPVESSDAPRQPNRNVGVAAHIDAGKTTLTERLLLYTGAIRKAGNVDDGNTTTDFDPIERRKGITIFAAAVSCAWTRSQSTEAPSPGAQAPHRLNIIDTPGHVDFTAEVERSLRVLDGMIAVFCAVGGVQPQSETVWRQANRHAVPRLAFINKMDRVGANFARVLDELRQKLGANAWPVLLPWGAEQHLIGQFDVIDERAFRFTGEPGSNVVIEDLPPEARAPVAAARAQLVGALAEIDEDVASLWLDNNLVPAGRLRAAIRRATRLNQFVPVIAGSAHRHVGIQPLLDAVVDYLPAPDDLGSVRVHLDDGTEGALPANEAGPAAALAFKIVHDDQGRRLTFLRVYSGILRKGDRVLNARTGRVERIGRLLRLFAGRREDIEMARAGDIVATIGLAGVSTGDTVCAPDRPIRLERPVFPEPVVSMALEPRSNADRDRLAKALSALSDEDPTFRTFTDPETGQSIISGMGELHLDVIRERLRNDHGVEPNAGPPAIAYRETIGEAAEAEHLLKKQNGGVGQYARVCLGVRPIERGRGVTIENRVTGGGIPLQFIKAVRQGIEEGLRSGAIDGNPVVDVHVDILDGAAHARDSNDQAFRLAAAAAVRAAIQKARPLLLEPIMAVEVDAPSESQGDLVGDLNRRRGRVVSMETGASSSVVIRAQVPLAELWGYDVGIRSLSRGRAGFSMVPSHFEIVLEPLVDRLKRVKR